MDDTTRPPPGMPSGPGRRFGPIRPLVLPLVPVALAVAVALGGGGCKQSPTPGPRPRPVSLDEAIQQQTQPSISAPALVNGDPVSWNELRPRLAEAAGRLVLEEVALEQLLNEALADRGLSLSPGDVARERDILLNTVDPEGARDRDQRLQLLEAVRVRRGLGAERLDGLLKRSAMLRKLVADRVEVTEPMVRQRYQTLYGEQYVVRAIILPTEADAARALRDLYAPPPQTGAAEPEGAGGGAGGEPGDPAAAQGEGEGQGEREENPPIDPAVLRARFIDLAIQRSTDPSGDRGGLLDPISPADPTYPPALREAISRMTPGEVAGPMAIDGGADAPGGFALLLLEERLPPEPVSLDEVRDAIHRELQLRQERILMGELAERLLDSAEIRPLDPGLKWSWEARER